MNEIIRHYADTSFGQVHVRCYKPEDKDENPPLICLHPAPSSGLYFTTAMPLLGKGRHVTAPDYPGYGGSDAQEKPLSIADYAAAVVEALDFLCVNRKVDLLGFHTGCLVAAEFAHNAPDWVRKVMMCDVPYFTSAQQDAMRDKVTQPLPITGELSSLEKPWDFNITNRIDDVPLPRAVELLAEHLRTGTRDWFAFDAAFRYDCEGRFSSLQADVTCLATQSGLHAPTVAAADVIPGATLVDVPEITSAVFESGAEAIAKRILEVL